MAFRWDNACKLTNSFVSGLCVIPTSCAILIPSSRPSGSVDAYDTYLMLTSDFVSAALKGEERQTVLCS